MHDLYFGCYCLLNTRGVEKNKKTMKHEYNFKGHVLTKQGVSSPSHWLKKMFFSLQPSYHVSTIPKVIPGQNTLYKPPEENIFGTFDILGWYTRLFFPLSNCNIWLTTGIHLILRMYYLQAEFTKNLGRVTLMSKSYLLWQLPREQMILLDKISVFLERNLSVLMRMPKCPCACTYMQNRAFPKNK